MFTPSIYQQDIFNFIERQVMVMKDGGKPENLMCIAGAGCAKSTTMVESTKKIPFPFLVKFLAFNTDIVDALKPKLPVNATAQTFHSAGMKAINNRFKNVKIDDNKMTVIFQELTKKLEPEEVNELMNPFLKLVGLVKNTFTIPSPENLENLIEEYDVEINIESDKLYGLVREGIIKSNSMLNIIDYNDMLYMSVLFKLEFDRSHVVIVDETQDLNSVQLLMLKMMVKSGGFIVCVGDENQSIYRFRGADSEAMKRIKTDLNMKILPLMETYRCGKKIVKLANRLVPELVAFDKNPDGEYLNINYNKFYDLIKEGDMVLCRNTAPLVKIVFRLLAKGINATIKGRDMATGLLKIIEKFKVSEMKDFYEKLEKWKTKEEEKALKKKSGNMMQTIADKYECLMSISEDCENVSEIIIKINEIFSDNKSPIILSTVHRAKGLEADRVFIVEPRLMPSKYAVKLANIRQEMNILYVAITRARNYLYIVNGVVDFSRFELAGLIDVINGGE